MKNVTALALFALALTGAVQTASAAITSYSRAAFQAALTGGTISGQDFDSLAAGTILGTLDGVTYGASAGSPVVTGNFLTTTAPNGLGSTSVGFFQSNESATFSFATPITAFAIDINTFAAVEGEYQAVLNIGDTVTSRFDVFPGQATGQFLGFISDTQFSSLTISVSPGATSPNTTYTLDSLVYGEAEAVTGEIPEPSTWGLAAAGLLALAWRTRRTIRS